MSREHSSVGRASALQAGGHRFEPYCSHQCGNGSVVERYLAKVNVASSNLVSRSIKKEQVLYLFFFYGAGNEMSTRLACEPSLAFERSENPAEGSRLRETAVSRFPDIKLIGFVPIPFAMERETREKPNSQSSAPEERSSEEVCRGIPPNGNKTTRRVKGGNGSISFPLNQSSRLCAYFFLGDVGGAVPYGNA